MRKSTTASCQLVPLTKNIRQAVAAPTQAKPANKVVGRRLRSAMPPTTMRTRAEMIVETVAV